MQTKNILHITDNLDSNDNNLLLIELAKAEKENGLSPIVISDSGILASQLVKSNIKHIKISIKNIFSIIKYIKTIKKFIQNNKIDTVIAHSIKGAWLSYFALKNSNIPLIIDFNDYHTYQKYHFTKKIDSIITKASKIIVHSKFMHDYIINNFTINKNQITLIPYCINIANYDSSKITTLREMDFLQKYNINLEKKLISIIDTVSVENGFNFLLELANNISRNDVCFVIACTNKIHDQTIINYKKLLKLYKLEEKIALIENLSDTNELLKTSHGFLNLSGKPNENISTLLIANAMQVPVMAPNVGSKPEFINSEYGFSFELNNPSRLKEYINHLLDMPLASRQQLQHNCLEFAKQFSIDKYISKYLNCYN